MSRTRGGSKYALSCVTCVALSLFAMRMSAAQIIEANIPDDPIRIDSGHISGKLLPSAVRAYFGVPFAAPPVLDLRWREPQPVKPWRGTYHADRFAPQCIQILRPSNINHYFGHEATSEDCLYLNIWAPPANPASLKAPIIVWIHGGGFSIGSPSMANYGGENLARKGALYVAIAYRVGGFGFMAHPQLSAESISNASGNYGFLDQVAALRWIQRNIERFGGDPERVIIAGQSAGAESAFALQTSPLAKGLFRGIVGMSGGGLRASRDPVPLQEAQRAGIEMQQLMRANSLAELRAVPADRLLAAQAEFQLGGTAGTVRFRPTVDGYFWPRSPREVFATGQQNDVPIVLGFTRDESSNELRTADSVDAYQAVARKYFGNRADEFLRLYPVSGNPNLKEMGDRAARDGGMATSIRSWALAHKAKGRSPAYIYMFAHPHTYPPGIRFADLDPAAAGAYHTSEVPYFLATLDVYNRVRETRAWSAADRELAERMSDLLLAFAQSNHPKTAQIALEPFDKREIVTVLDNRVSSFSFDRRRMEFFATVDAPGVVAPPPSGGSRARD
jgi:para-nitrobenzyl esterase